MVDKRGLFQLAHFVHQSRKYIERMWELTTQKIKGNAGFGAANYPTQCAHCYLHLTALQWKLCFYEWNKRLQ